MLARTLTASRLVGMALLLTVILALGSGHSGIARTWTQSHIAHAQPTPPEALVWEDRSSGQGVEIWTAATDGSGARKVAEYANDVSALALSDGLVALRAPGRLLLLNLSTGARS